MSVQPITVSMPFDWQGIVIFFGDDAPIILSDDTAFADLPDLIDHPVQRAVIATRLRGWADLIESGDPR